MVNKPTRPHKCDCGVTLFRQCDTTVTMRKAGAAIEFTARDPFFILCGSCGAVWSVDTDFEMKRENQSHLVLANTKTL